MEHPFQIITKSETPTGGTIVLEPLRQGFGHTLGNALRRVMLTHLRGAAPVRVKIKGATHQFTTLKGMKEDIVELVLNLKKIRVGYQGETPETLKLEAVGPGQVLAKDLKGPATVKIANPELVLATLADKKSKLGLELTVESGSGYALAEEQGKQKLGVIPLDAAFSPVNHVSYTVKSTRVGRRTDFDSLVLKIQTDGTVTASESVTQAAQILVDHFRLIVTPAEVSDQAAVAASPLAQKISALTVEELELPTRVANSLHRGGYKTLGDLSKATAAEIAKVKNIGGKSVIEIIAELKKKGIIIKE